MTPLLHGHLDIGRSLYGPAGDGAVTVVIATVLFETLVGPLSNYIPSVASCHIVGGVCWVQDDGPFSPELSPDTGLDDWVLQRVVLGPVNADELMILEQLHHSGEAFIQPEVCILLGACFPCVDS